MANLANQLTGVTTYLSHQVIEKAPAAFDLLCQAMRLSAGVQLFQGIVFGVFGYLLYKVGKKCYALSDIENAWPFACVVTGVLSFGFLVQMARMLFSTDIFITLISPTAELALIALRKAGIELF